MAYILGILLFALGIGITIALHEAGHMLTARSFGMWVRRYYIGFGPKIWAKKKGRTEYGFAALPVGGFCDIAGMTANDEFLTDEEEPYAMYKKPAWQRVLVMAAGILVNIVLGFSILFCVAVTTGLPDVHADVRPKVGEVVCSADQIDESTYEDCTGTGPAGAAGVEPGDIIVALDGEEIADFNALREAVIAKPGETVTLTVERDGQPRDFEVHLDTVERLTTDGQTVEAGSIGLTNAPLDIVKKYNAATAVPATADYSWYLAKSTVDAIIHMPEKVPGIVASIFGHNRADDSPMSVVGASRVGGELVENSLWSSFFMMLASLNYFLALFNLIPLPPFDGGHIAVIAYEKIRDALRRARGLSAKGPADYTRLMPVTYVMAAILMTFGALVIIADVVNPIRLFG